ncbi:MAG TPA: DUF6084 family protein [Opitutaceae bacterium]|nr:DUF6084 family protein [Opitutaceae bacterium]
MEPSPSTVPPPPGPGLRFQVNGAETGAKGPTPLLCFRLGIENSPSAERIERILLRVQIGLRPARRCDQPWTQLDLTVPAFTGRTEVPLVMPCSYDLDALAAKNFYAIEEGDVSLSFLFSGTVLPTADDGRPHGRRISPGREYSWPLPVALWEELMNRVFPASAGINLDRDVFDGLQAFKRRERCATWDQAIERLLATEPAGEAVPA